VFYELAKFGLVLGGEVSAGSRTSTGREDLGDIGEWRAAEAG